MTRLTWDALADRLYETGVDHGVLYLPDESGDYTDGVAWNGLETVTETPAGAAATPTYADNIKYLNLIAIETFGGTIQAYTYPDEFGVCDGSVELSPGVRAYQQRRQTFGLCYRTKIGNPLDADDHGFKLHLAYGLTAQPSEKAYASINDTPAPISFSWTFESIPIEVTDNRPTALLTIDSTKVDESVLSDLMDILYGESGPARLPLPDEVAAMFKATITAVDMGIYANQPTYVSGTHVVTLPTVTGVLWRVNGEAVSDGAQPALDVGETSVITAHAAAGYQLTGDTDWTFDY